MRPKEAQEPRYLSIPSPEPLTCYVGLSSTQRFSTPSKCAPFCIQYGSVCVSAGLSTVQVHLMDFQRNQQPRGTAAVTPLLFATYPVWQLIT
jgi:hypothetical protein